jgi:NADH-quinone oxidoreductase subunit M
LQKAFFSDVPPAAHAHEHGHELAAITWPEVTGFTLLGATSLLVGLWPRLLLDSIEPAVKALLAGGAQ